MRVVSWADVVWPSDTSCLAVSTRTGSGPYFVIESALRWSDGVQDALAEQVEVGSAVHLPLDHLKVTWNLAG